ncbi:MAG: arylsulfatase [Sedimentisphaerales bacterium]|jgi:arylsulfatase|nr:arylsulfatase [Sedimentisphaerales bacterium]HNY80267.1 arylsulfatase [Sedimentisphaerales bacterium]HOH66026.1 arylsulfatase [Sedimentisphaerales bacterium]HQA89773.1 arylsulfatase [Sedimentisphaerales bacterium]HQN35532.1 arylsulfatase [Sedimentisphaerales bacterium]
MKRASQTLLVFVCGLALGLVASVSAAGQGKKPNILVIMGDDIGQSNISVFTKGLVGYRTPNIDRIAKEGMLFTDYYAEQSCTAGRSSFITGQTVFRTGMSKVGIPSAPQGLRKKDPTIAEMLKPLGYATGQFGKNHLGDRNEFLPTVHGFDEFFGNLYHLNAEEEPEDDTYPQDPKFHQMFGPRGVLLCKATDNDDPTVDPRFGKVGKQSIEDTGPLTRKRMETIDDETSAAAIDFIQRQSKAGKPFFCWFNPTRMHVWTHVRPEHRSPKGATAPTEYADGMVEHDGTVGLLLKALDDLGIADDTIVLYTTDNGPHANTWPDAANTPFRGEKNTGWEGGFRVPCFIRWPGHIKPDSASNEIVSGLDWLPTLLAAAGDPDVKQKLLKGYTVGDTTYKVHLDGYNILPYLTGQQPKSPRREFFYFSDDGEFLNLRYENWKFVFAEQRSTGTFAVWAEPFTPLRIPKFFDLRADPYERADVTSNTYYDFCIRHIFLMAPAVIYVEKFVETFREYPPSQLPQGVRIQQALDKMKQGGGGL